MRNEFINNMLFVVHFSGKITFYTHPPEHEKNEHESATVVQYWGAGFDLVIIYSFLSVLASHKC